MGKYGLPGMLIVGLLWMAVSPVSMAKDSMFADQERGSAESETEWSRDFLDDGIARLAAQHNTPGAVVLWVQDGELQYRLNHGYGSLEGETPIHPEKSLMRIGSIAKPFTGLAALSLVEEGKLDLDSDVNGYFEQPLIPQTYADPVTLRHLLTHTPGFDDFYIGKSVRTREELPALEESVRSLLPRRIAPPGEFVSYSNYGVMLTGHLVERAAGDGFNSVVTDRVFGPLEMNDTTFDPGEELLENVVKGYFPMGEKMTEVPFDYLKDGPAGQMLTTAVDMTRFMEMVTTTGPLPDEKQVIKDRFLQASQIRYAHHPKFRDGVGFLWMVMEWNGHRVVAHDGGYPGLMARLMVFPDYNSAMFIFTNTMNTSFVSDVTDMLFEVFLPEKNPPAEETTETRVPLDDSADSVDVDGLQVKTPEPAALASTEPYDDGRPVHDFAGYFRDSRYSRDSMAKAGVLMGMVGEMALWVTDDGYLGMPDHTGATRRLVRVDSLLFASLDDDYHLAFREEGGRITHVFTSGRTALERIRYWEQASIQLLVLISALVLFAGIILFFMIRLPVRVLRREDARLGAVPMLVLALSGIYVLQMLLLLFGGLSIPFYELFSGFAYGVPDIFYVANLLPWAGLVLTVALIIVLARSRHGFAGRVASMLFVLLSLVYLVSLYYWNLCGWHF